MSMEASKDFHDMFYYDESVLSCLAWKIKRKVKTIGSHVGSMDKDGYWCVCLNRKHNKVHRIIWEMANGKIPNKMHIDHIDGNPSNNKISNLRIATNTQNSVNSVSRKGGSEYKGVCWHKVGKKWRAQVKNKDKQDYLGLFVCEHQAAMAYNKRAKELFGDFAKLNIIKEGWN